MVLVDAIEAPVLDVAVEAPDLGRRRRLSIEGLRP